VDLQTLGLLSIFQEFQLIMLFPHLTETSLHIQTHFWRPNSWMFFYINPMKKGSLRNSAKSCSSCTVKKSIQSFTKIRSLEQGTWDLCFWILIKTKYWFDTIWKYFIASPPTPNFSHSYGLKYGFGDQIGHGLNYLERGDSLIFPLGLLWRSCFLHPAI